MIHILFVFPRTSAILDEYVFYFRFTLSLLASLRIPALLFGSRPRRVTATTVVFGTHISRQHTLQHGYTALMRAAQRGHFDCVRLLLELGAKKNSTTSVRREC